MANFDMAELALKSVCPNNAMKYDDKETTPSSSTRYCPAL